ncbi:hypothetical protein [Natronolimnohabitans innermongolicus]|uniref:Uncharacterized protein n=1 Tax=Natronolimnohabitans innermongolicus JCM 12255 TaxID=1227499 RepID=L9WWS7_9EURY|nr:hypothetical protein [Natronolimnohabitans innermongolicus]ELY52793.1 hypothetical protein C493_15518 [Natronolimnohabitans innermongolicus JCM 12255]
MTDENALHVTGEAREYQEGFGQRENREIADHGGIVRDETISRAMSIREIHYDPTDAERPDKMPGQCKDLEKHRQIRMVEGTETFRRAMENGDMPTIKHMVGDTSKRADVSGMKAIGTVDQLIDGPAPVIVVLGEMGAGKTDFACLLAQRWRALNRENSLLGTNIQSLEEKDRWVDDDGDVQDGWIPDYGTLMEWVEQDGDPLEHSQRPKLFIGDEFSSAASGTGKQGYETRQKMAPLVYKIRKYGGALIYIAHGERSIHPMLWRVGTIVKKVSKKKAVIADSIKSAQLADIQGEIEGVPPTDFRYNTKEASDWNWSQYGDETDELEADEAAKMTAIRTAIRCKEEGMTDRETAKYIPYSHGWVNSRWNEYRNDGKHAETLGKVEEVIA